jgi:oxygen-independent coproporphyrinogen-3 oxidase
MRLDVLKEPGGTEVGNYFVSNYPPFSAWSHEFLPAAERVLHAGPTVTNGRSSAPLGLYLHIPFCRKRCHFCYFRVYTDKNSSDVDVYVNALAKEIALYAQCEGLDDREFEFVYFGGGTPSFLSSEQLQYLIDRIAKHWRWERAREVTFECEPGTLKKSKLETIKSIGTTRLSLGVEHFDDDVLSINGRAHKSPEIGRAYQWAREVGFPQINIDLIAGMVGDTEDKWKATVDLALAMRPDSVTIYQMEVPHNTTLAKHAKESGELPPVPGWPTKRTWVDHAFGMFEREGYEVSSAYTLVRPSEHSGFVYRDALWHGGDMVGAGVASFSHFAGVHFQNVDSWDDYVGALEQGRLPLARALPLTERQRLIREFILQLKLGRVERGYFRNKFSVDIRSMFGDRLDTLRQNGLLTVDDSRINLTREGLLRVDGLLPFFFENQFQNVRYT